MKKLKDKKNKLNKTKLKICEKNDKDYRKKY